MLSPIPDNELERLAAVRAVSCTYAPREERFDRITRTVKRLLHVPIAIISIVEQEELWYRSVQGLEIDHMARDISFCGHAVASNKPLFVQDTWESKEFYDNPLVTGDPHIRAYMGWPLEIAPGLAAGTLCVLDTIPRRFDNEEREGLRDLANMAATELRISAMASLQNRLVMRLDTLQRKGALDPVTGCWNIRGFRALLSMGVEEARQTHTDLAVCTLRINNLDDLAASVNYSNRDALTVMLAQVLRQRLPLNGALARLGPDSFCALIPARSALSLEYELAKLTFPRIVVNLPDQKLELEIPLSIQVAWLVDLGPKAGADALWAQALRMQLV